jgi:hypothetical protein
MDTQVLANNGTLDPLQDTWVAQFDEVIFNYFVIT